MYFLGIMTTILVIICVGLCAVLIYQYYADDFKEALGLIIVLSIMCLVAFSLQILTISEITKSHIETRKLPEVQTKVTTVTTDNTIKSDTLYIYKFKR